MMRSPALKVLTLLVITLIDCQLTLGEVPEDTLLDDSFPRQEDQENSYEQDAVLPPVEDEVYSDESTENTKLPPESIEHPLTKRSAGDSEQYADSSDAVENWKRYYDPGYESYMQSVGYDPFSAYGKRAAKRNGYDSYMQSIGYDPMSNGMYGKRDSKRNGYDSYMQSIGYDPMAAFGKRYDYLQNVGYDPFAYYAKRAEKRSDYDDIYYPQHFLNGPIKRPVRSVPSYLVSSLASNDWKRAPNEMGANGFHEGIFTHNFGSFSPVKRGKREVEVDNEVEESKPKSDNDKRRMGMGASGFHGDTFSGGFGDFSTMKKRRLGMGASGFHGDTFSNGFGDFSTMKKRRLGMGASGFHGDTFSGGFGDFSTMKKRRMGMGASGFHGDTFSGGFGDFSTMKKRRLGMGASGFHGDTFSNGFGDFSTMKKRRMGMGASGFHGDTFSGGFGDFSTMKKRRLGMGASGFHGDTFSNGFGDFSTMKRSDDKGEKEISSTDKDYNTVETTQKSRRKRSPDDMTNIYEEVQTSDYPTSRDRKFIEQNEESRNKRSPSVNSHNPHNPPHPHYPHYNLISDSFGKFETMKRKR